MERRPPRGLRASRRRITRGNVGGLGVAMIALLAFVQIATKSVQNSGISARATTANQLAIQGMEWIKNEREVLGWVNFQAKAGATTYCLQTLTGWVGGACGLIDNVYTRTALITVKSATNPKRLTAEVSVTWQESGKVYTAVQTTEFTNFY